MGQKRLLVAGNWKMNGLRADAELMAEGLASRCHAMGNVAVDIALFPPSTLLDYMARALDDTPVVVGGQDCHRAEKGAFTGDLSAWMLRDVGASYVLLGHSERRAGHAESSAQVKDKAQAAQAAGLVAIICVGENSSERDRGETLAVVGRQVQESLPAGATHANTIIAYEPVWAIGSGQVPSTEEIANVHGEIRRLLVKATGDDSGAIRILYGGSVKPSNAAEILGLGDVDGALVGGASLILDDFWAIVTAAVR